MNRGTLPGVDADADPPVVAHVDVDCFYAACERLREPALEGEPVVVGMGYEPGEAGGAVATASYEAREFGVESAMAISEALELLPRREEEREADSSAVEGVAADDSADGESADGAATGIYRPVDLEFYESVAADVKTVLHEAAETVREVSVDEAYLSLPVGWDDDPAAFVRGLKRSVEREAGVTASVGVAPTMSAAKVASDHDKPDGLVVVGPGSVESFLAPLDVAEIHGVGPVTARELRSMGIETAGELAGADPATLAEAFGERGREIGRYARGEDDRSVEPTGEPKSLSRESAFREPTADSEAKRERVELLAADVAERAARKGALYRTIGIKVVTPPFDTNTRARSLPGPVEDATLVESVALDLLGEFADATVRKLGVRVSKLTFAETDQASLDGWTGDGTASSADDSTGPARAGDAGTAAGGETAPDGTERRSGQRSLGEFSSGSSRR